MHIDDSREIIEILLDKLGEAHQLIGAEKLRSKFADSIDIITQKYTPSLSASVGSTMSFAFELEMEALKNVEVDF